MKLPQTIKWAQFIPDENSMQDLGGKLALPCISAKTIVFLYGQLGAGKTTLVRGLLRGLGYAGPVKSPTYTLVESYDLFGRVFFHFDFYRLRDPEELEFIGIDDYFSQEAVFLIEWPELGLGLLPPPDLSCYIEIEGEGRRIRIEAETDRGKDVLEYIQK